MPGEIGRVRVPGRNVVLHAQAIMQAPQPVHLVDIDRMP